PRAGGIPSLLSHQTTGCLYRPGDLKEAAHLTRALLWNDDLRSRLGAAARQAIEDRNWQQSIGRVRQAYVDAISSGRCLATGWSWKQRLAQLTVCSLVSLFRKL